MASPSQRRFILSQPHIPIGLRQRVARQLEQAMTTSASVSTQNLSLLLPKHLRRAAIELFSGAQLTNIEQQQQYPQPPYTFPFDATPPNPHSLNVGASSLALQPSTHSHTSTLRPSIAQAPVPGSPEDSSTSTALVPVGPRAIASITGSDNSGLDSYQALVKETHEKRVERQKERDCDKGTGVAYPRHVKNYAEWWAAEEFKRQADSPNHVPIPPFPINVTKAACFLEYELTRPKRAPNGEEIENTSVGRSHISQVINALERQRAQEAWEYPNGDEVHTKLRDDIRIKEIEKTAAVNERTRASAQAHSLKASGSSSDSYTSEEIENAAVHLLLNRKTANESFLASRNLAMFLLPIASFFRGDNIRRALFSDMFFQDIPNIDREVYDCQGNYTRKHDIETLCILVDKAKHNTNGRVDEHGMIRHRIVEFCGMGALARYFFAMYHIKKKQPPSFEPRFGPGDPAEYGTREWYDLFLFPGKDGEKDEMAYSTHRDIIKDIHLQHDIDVSKVTHCGRLSAVFHARRNGASETAAKALGGWSESGSYRACYDRMMPLDGLMSAAGWNGKYPERHLLLRGLLNPPAELLKAIFPFLDEQLERYQQRRRENHKTVDYALKNFLDVLGRFRRILLQDLAVLSIKYPAADILRYEPFNQPAFRNFAMESKEIMERAQYAARMELEKYPETVQTTLQSMLLNNAYELSQIQSTVNYRLAGIQDTLQGITNANAASEMGMQPSKRQKKNKKATPSTSQPSIIAPPLLPSSAALAITAPPTLPSSSSSTALVLVSNADISEIPEAPDDEAKKPYSELQLGTENFRRLSRAELSAEQEEAMVSIENKFGKEKVSTHQWKWMIPAAKGYDTEEWIPEYAFKPNATRREIWDEFMTGYDGHLSVEQLEDEWSSRWKTARSHSTEYCRRNKLVALVRKLRNKRGWTTDLAFRFLDEKYPIYGKPNPPKHILQHLRTTLNFIRWLQDTGEKKGKKGKRKRGEDDDGEAGLGAGDIEAGNDEKDPNPHFTEVVAASMSYP